MYSEAMVSAPLSRPKIHRLPVTLLHDRRHAKNRRAAIVTTAAIVSLTLLAYMADRLARSGAEPVAQEPAIPDIYEPKAMTDAAPAKAALAPAASGQSIVIRGEHGGIIGQLARIPTQNQQMTEIKTISEIDNRAGRELLGIIGRY